ncbi:Decapping nuclease [Venturia nashicola]|nr:Decapping nuclease [Venturia nashicola]
MTRIFATGATGYIGGDALYAIAQAHPAEEYEMTLLVRNSDKGALVAKQYPKARLVYGDLDSVELITEESSKADIVCHWANCDHEASAYAIVKGLSSRSTQSFFIHTSGTGILTYADVARNSFGTSSTKVYDDWENVSEVTSLPDQAWHRNVDKIVLAAGGNIKTAIVCPPTIYGPGRGPGNTYSDQWYFMAKGMMEHKYGFMVGEGQNKWTYIHVHDLSQLYLRLVEEAAQGGGKATWGAEGYYFAENGEYVWADMAKKIAAEVHKQGFIDTAEVRSIRIEKANEITPNGGPKWGYNSRCRAIRANKLFGWTPKGEPIEELLPSLVKDEAMKLGLKAGHAVKAAGDA